MTRRRFTSAGVLFSFMWLACFAATVIPGSDASYAQWFIGNGLAFLAGGALAFAATKSATQS
ncbi:hypothetical protein PX52LOC_04505 [Limnoglobus roseus]|uniref:Uncharacterized protein n=1 Tax=Limnoglobus roseus TaxID=2598579 RepID=A0A5C1AFY3_9BACT|nr:hypothetical protein PX52LOC_04505 [Limnoglobus roseus]